MDGWGSLPREHVSSEAQQEASEAPEPHHSRKAVGIVASRTTPGDFLGSLVLQTLEGVLAGGEQDQPLLVSQRQSCPFAPAREGTLPHPR